MHQPHDDKDNVFVGTYLDGSQLVVPVSAVKNRMPVFRPGHFYYADDGRLSYLRVSYPFLHGYGVASIALRNQVEDKWLYNVWEVRRGEQLRPRGDLCRELAVMGMELEFACWIEGRLDPQGGFAGAQPSLCIYAQSTEPLWIVTKAWHPHLRLLALEKRLKRELVLAAAQASEEGDLNAVLPAERRGVFDALKLASVDPDVHGITSIIEEADPMLRLGAA